MKTPARVFVISGAIITLLAVAIIVSLFQTAKIIDSPKIESSFTATTTPESKSPEIAVNEYWNVYNFPNRHIYVNNTDKAVIYILDDAGKKVGEFWAKDYGFPGGFEIRSFSDMDGPIIFITAQIEKNTRLVALDPIAAKFLWQEDYAGYLDMPQVQQLDKYNLLFENYGSNSGNRLSRVNIRTGAIIWELYDPNNFGIYYSKLTSPNEFLSNSGGVGTGRWQFRYILDTAAGKITSEYASIADQELAGATRNTTLRLLWYPQDKAINLTKIDSHEVLWTSKPGDQFYNYVTSAGPGKTSLYIYENVIVTERVENDEIVIIVFDIHSKKLLWKTLSPTGPNGTYFYTRFDEYKNILIGLDAAITKEGYEWFHIAFDEKTGQVLWKLPCSTDNLCTDPDFTNGTLTSVRGGVTTTIDLLTGK